MDVDGLTYCNKGSNTLPGTGRSYTKLTHLQTMSQSVHPQ